MGVGLGLNVVAGTRTYYRFIVDHAASSNAQILRINAGSGTTIDTWTQTFTDGDQFTFAQEGPILYVFDKNFAVARKVVDTSPIVLAGSPSINYSSTDTSASLDNWEAGFFEFAAVGSIVGNSSHPGRSPGLAGGIAGSARFVASNWWPYSPPAPATDFDPALMAAMNRPWPDIVFSPPQVVASGMTPSEATPT